MVTTLKQKQGFWRNGSVSNARNFWNHRRSQTMATPNCYLTRKVRAHLQVPVCSSLMACLVQKWFSLFFAQRYLYIPKEQPINYSFVVTMGLVKRSTDCHVLSWKQSVSPGSVFICTEPHNSWLSQVSSWRVILSFFTPDLFRDCEDDCEKGLV